MFDKFKTWLRVKPQKNQSPATTFYLPPSAPSDRVASSVMADRAGDHTAEVSAAKPAPASQAAAYPSHFPPRPTSSPLPSGAPPPASPPPLAQRPPTVTPIRPAAPLPRPAALEAAPAPSHPAPKVGSVSAASEVLMVPWSSVASKWSPEIRQSIELTGVVPKALNLPIQRVEALLKQGRVVFPWGELCQWIDPVSAAIHSAFPEDTPIEIPASLVAPLFFSRMRPVEKAKSAPKLEDFPDLFMKREEPSAAPVALPKSASAEAEAGETASLRQAPQVPLCSQPAPSSAPGEVSGIAAESHLPAKSVAETTPALQPGCEPIVVSWKDVLAKLPEELREVFGRQPISPRAVSFPYGEIESSLKRGRVRFSWSQICGWFSPPMPSFTRVLAPETVLDIPLPLVAPAYLARAKGTAAAQPLPVANDIPDLFPAPGGRQEAPFAAMEPEPVSEPAPTIPAPRIGLDLGVPGSAPADLPRLSPEPEPLATKPRETAAASPGLGVESLRFAWQEIWAKWPEATRTLTASIGATAKDVEVPVAAIEAGLRRGKIEVKWADLRAWLTPPLPDLEDALSADLSLEIPLALAAPRFLGLRQTSSATRKEIVIPEDIPSPFASMKLPASESPRVAPVGPVAPIMPPVTPEAVAVVEVPPVAPLVPTLAAAPAPAVDGTAEVFRQMQLPAAMMVASLAPFAGRAATYVVVSLDEVTSGWSRPVCESLSQSNGVAHQVRVPVGRVEEGLARGCLRAAWSELSEWIVPPLTAVSSAMGEGTMLEMPLPVLAGAYLKLRSEGRGGENDRAGIEVSEKLAPAAKSALNPPASLGPLEFVQFLEGCLGVSGAVLASSDGLLVAARVPEGFDAEAMAAVLPRLYTHTLDMGRPFEPVDIGEVELGFRTQRVHIFHKDGFYAGVFGQGGQIQSLPDIRQLMQRTQLR